MNLAEACRLELALDPMGHRSRSAFALYGRMSFCAAINEPAASYACSALFMQTDGSKFMKIRDKSVESFTRSVYIELMLS